MKTGLVNFRIKDGFEDCVIPRRARTLHACHGGHDGEKRTPCSTPINPGTVYVEYLGESGAYSSGARYHCSCAVQQGLLEPIRRAS